MARQLRRGELLVDLRPDCRDLLDELCKPDIRAGCEQPLDRDETNQLLAVADRDVDGAVVGTAGRSVADVAGRVAGSARGTATRGSTTVTAPSGGEFVSSTSFVGAERLSTPAEQCFSQMDDLGHIGQHRDRDSRHTPNFNHGFFLRCLHRSPTVA
jgi:hypothetical protein